MSNPNQLDVAQQNPVKISIKVGDNVVGVVECLVGEFKNSPSNHEKVRFDSVRISKAFNNYMVKK